MEAMGPSVTNTAVYQLIIDYNMEGAGTLDFSRFIDLMSTKIPEDSSREYSNSVFFLFDS